MRNSKMKARILRVATQLFGKFGFEGVTTRGIAKMARCSGSRIFRLYGNKASLYAEVVDTVVDTTLKSMTTLDPGLYTETSGRMVLDDTVKAVVRRWYSSMSLDGARVLQQVRLNDSRRKQQTDEPFVRVLTILQTLFAAYPGNVRKGIDAKTLAEFLIWPLFQLKLSYAGPAAKERREVNRFLQSWLSDGSRER